MADSAMRNRKMVLTVKPMERSHIHYRRIEKRGEKWGKGGGRAGGG